MSDKARFYCPAFFLSNLYRVAFRQCDEWIEIYDAKGKDGVRIAVYYPHSGVIKFDDGARYSVPQFSSHDCWHLVMGELSARGLDKEK